MFSSKMGYVLVVTILLAIASQINGAKNYESLSQSSQLFADDLYKQISNRPGNILLSPISIQSVFALLQCGAKGSTLNQLSKVLHLPKNKTMLASTFEDLHSIIRKAKNVVINSANKICVRKDVELSDSFKKLAEMFDAEIDSSAFSDPETVAREINEWVELKTNNKIHEIIQEGTITPETVILLINAMYFNGNWVFPFDKDLTAPRIFYANGVQEIKVETMLQVTKFNYSENERLNAKFVELPYVGDDFVMTLILPNERTGLKSLENQLQEVLKPQQMAEYETTLSIPKFSVEKSVDLKGILKKLGLRSLFRNANLADIANNSPKLTVSKVIQKTFIEVNEVGTEAAAATGVNIEDRFMPSNRKAFFANHPFMFTIRQLSTGVIFFIGRFTEP